MSIELINIGTYPNDGSGDPIRTAFGKINDNFSQFSTVAFSGEYSSLYGTPVLSSVALSGDYSSLLNAPSLGALSALSSINNNNWTGIPLSIQNGGTGQTSAENAFNALSPISNPGDIIYGDTHSQGTVLGIGTNNSILTVVNNAPAWSNTTGPGGYNGQLQFNNNGIFGGTQSLAYQLFGNLLTVTSLASSDVPINIVGAPGQYSDFIDFTASAGTQGGIAKLTANGTLYTQGLYVGGSALGASSLELSNTHFYGQYFQFKTNVGSYASYMQTVNGNDISFYQANGAPISSLNLGNDTIFYRVSPGYIAYHNHMNPFIHRWHNWWQDDDHWEALVVDWQTETNVARFGTQHQNGIVRELHFMTGGVVAAKIDINQNFIHNPTGSALPPTATDGFLHLPMISGTPTGAPTFFSGAGPIAINEATGYLNVNINGTWYSVKLNSGAG